MMRFISFYYLLSVTTFFIADETGREDEDEKNGADKQPVPMEEFLLSRRISTDDDSYTVVHPSLMATKSFPSEMRTWVARADLHADSSSVPMGTLIFTQPDFLGSPVRVTGTLLNLIPNTRYHGFHVHMFALPDGEWDCSKAGDHWNPYRKIHGGRYDSIERRHVGDLGNIWSDQFGSATIDFEYSIIQLHITSSSSILNKAIVVHKDEDDLGRGMYSDSQTTGHAGGRIACGNIRIADTGNHLQQATWRPFLPRYCDCVTTTGQCMPYGSYQCYFNYGASIMQCVDKNRWIVLGSCPSSCRLWANGQPQCI